MPTRVVQYEPQKTTTTIVCVYLFMFSSSIPNSPFFVWLRRTLLQLVYARRFNIAIALGPVPGYISDKYSFGISYVCTVYTVHAVQV